jgi:hypothetical protein
MKGYNSKIYNSRQTSRQRRNKNRLLLLLIIFAVGVGGYLALPKIFKSTPNVAADAEVTTAPEEKMMTNEEQIIKTLPLPNLK